MNNQIKTILLSISVILVISLVTIHLDQATAKVDIDSLIDKYEKTANKSLDIKVDIKNKKESLNNETKKVHGNAKKITSLQQEIESLDNSLINNKKELKDIEKATKKAFEIPPEMYEKLENARKILRANQQQIPFTGLGLSVLDRTVIISILSDDPESYRELIEELVGKDIPVRIQKGSNPFKSCETKFSDCSTLIGGLVISNDENVQCSISFPVMKDDKYGFLTAGHCFKVGDIIYQPNSIDGGPIGEVTHSIFNSDCDCAFIEMTSSDEWVEKIFYKPNKPAPLENKTGAPLLGEYIAFPRLYVNVPLVWGLVDHVNWSCSDGKWLGGITIDGLYRTSDTDLVDGESGLPVSNPILEIQDYYGIAICDDGETGEERDMVFIDWPRIATHLGVE